LTDRSGTLELFFVGIFATTALIFVVYPVINPRKYIYFLDDLLGSKEEKKISYLQQKKALVYDNIKDLGFEHDMGKLSDEDYNRLRGGLIEEAETVVQELDKARIKREIDELIERDVQNKRKIK
jgi:hypothetical protein